MFQRILKLNGKREEEERIAAEQFSIARFRNALNVSIYDKGIIESNSKEYITYKFTIENKLDKDITAFIGQMIFLDLFNNEIKSLSFTYDDGVKANSTVNYSFQTDFDKFKHDEQLLKSKPLKKIKFQWKTEKILFTDGRIIE